MDIVFNYSKLKGKIVEKFGTRKSFAAAIGLSERSLFLKLKSRIGFTQDEIFNAAKLLDIPLDEITEFFFVTKVSRRAESKMAKVAALYELELEEVFKLDGSTAYAYKFSIDGLKLLGESTDKEWIDAEASLSELLRGNLKVRYLQKEHNNE